MDIGRTKTVGELMDILQKLKPEARVWVTDSEWGLLPVCEMRNAVARDRAFLGCDIRTGDRLATSVDLDVVLISGSGEA